MNANEEQVAFQLIYAGCEPEPNRFTNDLPINAEVWLAFRNVQFAAPCPLLLTPHLAAGIGELRKSLSLVLAEIPDDVVIYEKTLATETIPYLSSSESHVLAHITFEQLLRILPLSSWWERTIRKPFLRSANEPGAEPTLPLPGLLELLRDTRLSAYLARRILEGVQDERLLRQFKQIGLDAASHPLLRGASERQKEAVRRLINVVTLHAALTILDEKNASKRPKDVEPSVARHCSADLGILADAISHQHSDRDDGVYDFARPPLWGVASNRRAAHALAFSRKTVKADAAIRVFDTGGQGVRWAVVDSGIDATHPAFARWDKLTQAGQFQDQTTPAALSRVVKTLDFTRFAAITSGRIDRALANKLIGAKLPENELKRRVRQLRQSLANGQMLDWGVLEPLLEIAHQPNRPGEHGYERPIDSHGTHVAGIIGANWRVAQYAALREKHKLNVLPPIALEDQNEVCGVCPQIELLDLRVFDPKPGVQTEESATEFAILAALQYVRYLNQSKDRQYVHGVNLSLSLRHEVRSYACGSTPVCLECERLVGSGVIVVAAAGNYGYDDDYGASHLGGAYRGQSITDPGNAPSVLTVGSTHRSDPYQYGISYFSSHGPTGDGRIKPDLVAPGEKIISTVPKAALAAKDGTSMAAPHVSGVAALLLSRNSELMGHPGRVKEILCKSASDLGRGSVFQGYGLVDALRALQSV